ncbi:hypothetical protein AZI86_06830 [Bdellovibrio bacteriovorus]|uniref:Tetratricopeptide repeat protein n=1 Tax=Bdellovibrio bacteriovorus TaxID=959 RepID=A0A150WQJ3_BDEBC|nr:hypothetical protein [Bdellovibrio bacteriovorus]KYG66752.1 hypothetical protein AZI86_06830 [Bdellovibrio bacteriovorus]
MRLRMIRAVLATALSFSSVVVLAQSKMSRSETYKDIIEKAYNLSLQKDRQQALNILMSALQKESRPAAVAEIKKAVDEIAHIFFSDKAQQLYESGVSLRKNELPQSYDKLIEASRIEPDNFAIAEELARVMIARNDCKNAQETVQKQLNTVKHDEDLKLTLAQSLACQDKWAEYQKVFESFPVKKSPNMKYWLALEVEKNMSSKSMTKAQENLASLKKADEKYPEAFYWSWRFDMAQKRSNLEEAQKYVMTCKNISANQYRQYMIDPMLCRRIIEVEAEMKGANGRPE